ncbi:MAG: hypothetical protein IH968_09430 [Gemmatimonadetes bacterium]|nr:hypothetical protein [Gemmatimonadota bacterium]
MTDPISFDRTDDPLYRDVPLRHRVTLPVLGIPVTFASNAEAVLEITESAFGAWRVLDGSPMVDGAPANVNVVVHDEPEGARVIGGHPKLQYRMPGDDRTIVMSGGSVGVCDAQRRQVIAYVTPTLVADVEHFRYGFLEALTLAMLSQFDRQPLHAAAIVKGESVLLLAGASGVGKSSLCYEAARAGLQVLSDDVVNIQLVPGLRVWGMPGYLHLPVSARELFPELERHAPTLLANGKEKIALSLSDLGAAAPFPVIENAGLCVLERTNGEPSLTPLTAQQLEVELTSQREHGFDIYAETIREGIHQLARDGGWRLQPGHGVGHALPLLEEVFSALESRSRSAEVSHPVS